MISESIKETLDAYFDKLEALHGHQETDRGTEFIMACVSCEDVTTGVHGNKSQFIKDIKEYGWRHRQAGWMCPDCIKQQKALRKGDK